MELVKIYSADSQLDAEVIKSILDSEGIPAMLSGESCGQLLPGLFGCVGMGAVSVLVRPEDADVAREILADVRIEADMSEEEFPEDQG